MEESLGITFSIKESISKGFELFLNHWVFLVTFHIGTFVVLSLAAYLSENISGLAWFLSWFLQTALQLIIGIGTLYIMLGLVDGEQRTYMSVFDPLHHFWKYLGSVIIATIGTGLGLLLLIIPGVIFAAGICFAQYLVIDKGMGPEDSLRQSWERTRGHKKEIVLFLAALLGINIVGVLMVGVGTIVSIPVTGLAYAYAYAYRHFFPKA